MTFHTTRWSLVFRAADGGPDGPAALAELCEAYWPAVHAFHRRACGDEEQARDLTQGLFARLLERRDLASADPERGRFRSWLLACAQHHLVDVRRADGAEKRGGARTLPWPEDAEAGPLEPVDPAATPEEAFARAWVRAGLGDEEYKLEGLQQIVAELWRQLLKQEADAIVAATPSRDDLARYRAIMEQIAAIKSTRVVQAR